MEQYIKSVLDFLKDQFSILTGENLSGDRIVTANGGAASWKGTARRLVLLKDTAFTACSVEDEPVAVARGYTETITSPAVLSPGTGKKFTSFTIADGGQVQVIE